MAYEDPPIIYGDDADAAGYPLVAKTDPVPWSWNEHNRTRDLVAQLKTWTAAALAGINLSWSAITGKPSTFPPSPHGHPAQEIVPGTGYFGGGATYGFPTDAAANGSFYSFGASPAVSSYVVAYIDGSGRISKGASTERVKDDITLIDPMSLGDIFPDLYEFVMKGDAGRMKRVGNIAERLEESDDLRRFVVYERDVKVDHNGEVISASLARDADGNPIPESIDFIALLLAQVAQLNARITELEARE